MEIAPQIVPWPLDSPEAAECQRQYFAELATRLPASFDNRPFTGAGEPVVFLLIWSAGQALGCGMLLRLSADVAEIKRMWLHSSLRGQGMGRKLLLRLETEAVRLGFQAVRLDTNAALTEAIALYRATGYSDIAAYNGNPHATHWFEKTLARD